jgi:PBP1b-binding outer membrane lipoprotein LpoB
MKILLSATALALLLAACGDNASKKGPAAPATPPPAEKKVEPKK